MPATIPQPRPRITRRRRNYDALPIDRFLRRVLGPCLCHWLGPRIKLRLIWTESSGWCHLPNLTCRWFCIFCLQDEADHAPALWARARFA